MIDYFPSLKIREEFLKNYLRFLKMSLIARRNVFVDGVNLKNGVEVLPHWKKISVYEVTNMSTIIIGFLLIMR